MYLSHDGGRVLATVLALELHAELLAEQPPEAILLLVQPRFSGRRDDLTSCRVRDDDEDAWRTRHYASADAGGAPATVSQGIARRSIRR